MNRLLISCWAVVVCALPAQAQSSLPAESHDLIDTALSSLLMNRGDLWMPWDFYPDDAHRLPIVKDIFGTPLALNDSTQALANSLRQSPVDCSASLMTTLKLGRFEQAFYKDRLSAIAMDSLLGANLDSTFGLVGATVTRQYAGAMLLAREAILEERAQLAPSTLNLLLARIDSMLLYSEESKDLSVYELKESERAEYLAARRYFAAAEDVRLLHGIYSQGISLYHRFNELLQFGTSLDELYRDSLRSVTINTPYGRIAIGGSGDDVYSGDYFFIFDSGGNDRYLFPAQSKQAAFERPVQCIVDLGGDDVYSARDYALGGALFGCSLVFDLAGDDHYAARHFSQGAAVYGFAVLEDRAGNDLYAGGVFTQGSGAFGIGLLLDRVGNDVYRAYASAQGFGFTRGFGALADFQGNDSYLSSSPYQDFLRYDAHFVAFTQGAGLGYRPIASGGIGMLFEYQGNDVYISDIYGQGTAYWYALGGIYDEAGDDRYVAYQYAQGAGVHLAHGLLLDVKGNDHYYSHGVSQGCGHDVAFGGLIDLAGDDDYTAESLSMGGGNANAVSLLLDQSGDDTYSARNLTNMMGYSDFRREFGMIGIFVDGGGSDRYGSSVGNDSNGRKSTFGVFRDLEYVAKVEKDNSVPALTPPEAEREPLASGIDSLFTQASAAPQKYQYNVQPARDKITAMGSDALSYLAGKLSTESARERHALIAILTAIHDQDTLSVARLLNDSLQSRMEPTVLMSAEIARRRAVEQCVPTLEDLLQHPSWRVRSKSAHSLSPMDSVSIAKLRPLLRDSHPYVKMRVAYSLGRMLPTPLEEIARDVLRIDMQVVRNSFIMGIKRRNEDLPMPSFLELFAAAPDEKARIALAPLLPLVTESKRNGKEYRTFVRLQSPAVRESVYRAIAQSDNKFWRKTAAANRRAERNKVLQALIPDLDAKRR